MEIVNTVLQQMSSLKKPQRRFMLALLPLLMCLRGRVNFRNLSRYSDYHEKTFSRWYRRDFDFTEFNRLSLLTLSEETANTLIAAMDCRFIPKSGRHTEGLGKFYSGGTGRAEKGLEISTLAVVNVTENTAYHLSTRQTIDRSESELSRVDSYLHHLQQDRASLPPQVRYLVADGYYSKTRYLQGVVALGLHQIGKLRHDANLRWLYQGEQKPRGRKRRYDGKVSVDDMSRWTLAGNMNETQAYTVIVNSAHFKRDLRVVYLVKRCGGKVKTALLFSTDTSLDAMTLVTYDKARFQIEFLFREASSFWG
ncbi:transposase [Halomonas llamarensis]|uniref:Transposase n=1 Tax=Halomonas llamarensis TaxID=2945104 RepID=A0ABT0SLR1_9GAMM|nr:transposase [Halomonas llamarensis]MCL7928513.1 transposase [Halomonas llamarensis]